MHTLKDDIKIVIKSEGAVITRESLAHNQGLYDLVMNNPLLKARYGHNFIEGNYTPKAKPQVEQKKKTVVPDDTIEVNVKKKEDALKELQVLKPIASTSTDQKTGGMSLNVSENGQKSESKGLQPVKRKPGRPASKPGK